MDRPKMKRRARRTDGEGAPVTEFGLIRAEAVRSLSCPYCGRPMPRDEAGMFAAQARWGFVGARARIEGRDVGLLLVCASSDPSSSSAVAMVGAGWVHPDLVRRGIGRQLVRTVAAGLVAQRVGSLIAASGVAAGCVALPGKFLDAAGFSHTARKRIWRMDLGRTVVAKGTLQIVVQRLRDSLRPVPPPEPVARTNP